MTDPRGSGGTGPWSARWRARWRSASPRTRRSIAIASVVGAIAVVVGVLWLGEMGRRDERAHIPEAATGTKGMEGMAGMDMGSDGSVQLTADQLRQFGITFGTVDERMLEASVRASGVVAIDETRVSRVTPKVSGYVERVYADFTGYPVRRGQPLVELYSPEILAAQEELLLARRLDRTVGESAVPGVPSASTDLLGAARRRLRLLDMSGAQIDAVLRTGRVRRTVTLFAPTSGVVVEKLVVPGQAAAAGAPLYTIADLSRVWVDVDVPEADADALRPGVGADIELTGRRGPSYKGRVEFVHPLIDPTARTVRARVAVTNTDGVLKPGMYATVRITAPSRRALTVPASATINTGERSVVFVDMGAGRLMPHEVEVGRAAGDYVEILSGLEPGQRVVTSAQFLLESESNLGEVMKAMMSQMGSGDVGRMKGMGEMKDMPGMKMP